MCLLRAVYGLDIQRLRPYTLPQTEAERKPGVPVIRVLQGTGQLVDTRIKASGAWTVHGVRAQGEEQNDLKATGSFVDTLASRQAGVFDDFRPDFRKKEPGRMASSTVTKWLSNSFRWALDQAAPPATEDNTAHFDAQQTQGYLQVVSHSVVELHTASA